MLWANDKNGFTTVCPPSIVPFLRIYDAGVRNLNPTLYKKKSSLRDIQRRYTNIVSYIKNMCFLTVNTKKVETVFILSFKYSIRSVPVTQ